MLTKLLTPKIAGVIGGTLLAASLASGGLAYVQSKRLATAQETIKYKDQAIDLAKSLIENYRAGVVERDRLIATQNAAVEEIQKAREADRQAYLNRIAAADKRAQSHEARAAELLALPVPEGTELEQCRAARALIVEEMADVAR